MCRQWRGAPPAVEAGRPADRGESDARAADAATAAGGGERGDGATAGREEGRVRASHDGVRAHTGRRPAEAAAGTW